MTKTSPYTREVPKDRPWRIVFMGTPGFSVPSLQALIDSKHEVVGVYTQPDKPQGRGRKIQPPPVKKLAVEAGIPVFQPDRMTKKESLARFQEDKPDLAVVVAYGKILRQRILDVPPMGCINCHASILPKYRGANPIFWAVADGEAETGVQTMLMDAGMDTGDVLKGLSIPILPNETVGELHDRLAALSAQVLLDTLDAIEAGTLTQTTQEHDAATHAPMLDKSQFWVNFDQPALDVHNWIRAMAPRPGARSLTPEQKTVKLYESVGVVEQNGLPGQLLHADADGLVIACKEGAVRVKSIQFAGKKRVEVKQYLAGNSFPEGYTFGSPNDEETSS